MPKSKLKVKAALHEGKLISSVTIDGQNVTLALKAPFNEESLHPSINAALYSIYNKSTAFQQNFECPQTGLSRPTLRLKPGIHYESQNALINALQSFAAPTAPLNVKSALSDGRLISSVTIDGQSVTLALKPPFNEASQYPSINVALYKLYNISTAFQQSFEHPQTGYSRPALKLKPGIHYESQDALINALQSFAAPTAPLNVKSALSDGRLISSVTIDGQSVTLALKPPFNKENQHRSINGALHCLYRKSSEFQQHFEPPKQGSSCPTLRLKPGVHYESQDALINALQSFAAPTASLNVKSALGAGKLISSVTIDGQNVTLALKAPFNEESQYPSINAALYNSYNISTAFQQNFEQPKAGHSRPALTLKSGVHYESQEALISALQSFATPTAPLSVRSSLGDGRLISSVTIDGQSVTLALKPPFNEKSQYYSINAALYKLYNISTAFQQNFEQPKAGHSRPALRLKPGIRYESQDALINALQNFESSKTYLNVKSALGDGRLISSVTVDGQRVTLALKAPFNEESQYRSINGALYKLYNKSTAFQDNFERPKTGHSRPALRLKPGIHYKSQDVLINALQSFAASTARLNAKSALGDGRLISSVTIDGQSVTLALKTPFDEQSQYRAINDALYHLYNQSIAFQEHFEKPKVGYFRPALRLKPEAHYESQNALISALQGFAAHAASLNVKSALSKGALISSVTIDGQSVTLALKAPFNEQHQYRSINKALYHLYNQSIAFQENFERPKSGLSRPALLLKPGAHYESQNALISALQGFASAKSRNIVSSTPDSMEKNVIYDTLDPAALGEGNNFVDDQDPSSNNNATQNNSVVLNELDFSENNNVTPCNFAVLNEQLPSTNNNATQNNSEILDQQDPSANNNAALNNLVALEDILETHPPTQSVHYNAALYNVVDLGDIFADGPTALHFAQIQNDFDVTEDPVDDLFQESTHDKTSRPT